MSLDLEPSPPPFRSDGLAWTEALATGVEDIDDQHRSLFGWLAELESTACEQRMMTAAYALTRLVQYTRSHFAAEEKLMRECGYPRLDAHIAEHMALCDELKKMQESATSQDLCGETVGLLRQWLLKHVLGSDLDYVPAVRAMRATRESKDAPAD
jgi:hemerythrin